MHGQACRFCLLGPAAQIGVDANDNARTRFENVDVTSHAQPVLHRLVRGVAAYCDCGLGGLLFVG